MKHAIRAAAVALLFGSAAAQATNLEFSGEIALDNDVVRIPVSLAVDLSDVKLWTDSFMGGTNFDPVTALWSATTGALVAQNDDNPTIALGQTFWDSGLRFDALPHGDYVITVAVFDNFAAGDNLAQGFLHDGAPGQPLFRGPFWRVHLSDEYVEPPPVPEPPAWAIAALGLGLVVARTRRRR